MRTGIYLSTVLLLMAASNASGQTTPLDYEYYAKFPNHGDSSMAPPLEVGGIPSGTHMGLQRFYEMLRRMRNARDELRTYCIGPKWQDMVRTVRGAKVLIWPERFADCERDANLLDKGDPLYTTPLANWNKIYGTAYPLPRGEATDVQAWSRRKGEFLHFVESACNEASRAMVLAGDPGFAEPPAEVFERAKKRCPASWVRLFEPEEAIKKREEAAKRVCKPGTTYMVASTTGPGKPYETCDEGDKYVPSEKPPGSSSSASKPVGPDDLERELSALARGEFDAAGGSEQLEDLKRTIDARRQRGPDVAESLRQQLATQPKAGSIGGVEIFGGETGKMLEAAVRTTGSSMGGGLNAADSCDIQARLALTQAQTKAAQDRTQGMNEQQRNCARENARLQILVENLDFLSRCNAPQAEVNTMRGLVSEARIDAQRVCSAVPSKSKECPTGWVCSANGTPLFKNQNPFGNPNARP